MTEGKSSRSGIWVVLLIFFMGAAPFFGALYLVKHPGLWGTQGNKGRLIQPPVPVQYEVFHPVAGDLSRRHPLKEIRGRWVILHPLTGGNQKDCRKILEDTRRLHPLFSKDIPRVRRLAVWSQRTPPDPGFRDWLEQDRDLYLAKAGEGFFSDLAGHILHAPLRCGQVVIMDPLGNLMMWYDAGFDPYDLYHDLKRLLKASQIG